MLAPRRPYRAPRALLGSLLVVSALALGACGDDDDDDAAAGGDGTDPTTDAGGAGDTSMPAPGTDPNAAPDPSPVGYAIPLTVEEEVPAPTGVPEGATGEASLVFDPATGGITGTVTTSGLSGPPTMAHIHEQGFDDGELQPTGPVIVDFVPDGTGTGFVLPQDSVLTDEQVESLETGLLYVNVHTELNAPGEIRGQIVRDDREDGDDGDDESADTDGT